MTLISRLKKNREIKVARIKKRAKFTHAKLNTPVKTLKLLNNNFFNKYDQQDVQLVYHRTKELPPEDPYEDISINDV